MFINFNGIVKKETDPLFTAQNRSFRYGDGLFETIKVQQGHIHLAHFHFDRLFTGLQLLGITVPKDFTVALIAAQIQELCSINECASLSRVRLAVYRSEKNTAAYCIEAIPLDATVGKWNEKGLAVDIYPYTRKSCDAFANLKTANYLPYVLAQLYAQEKGLDECLVLNTENNICDGARTNIFLIIKDKLMTPALHQGCINGVMRRYLIDELKKEGLTVQQTEIPENLLPDAEEVFLTNAIQGIRWVKRFREKIFSSEKTYSIYQQLFAKAVQ